MCVVGINVAEMTPVYSPQGEAIFNFLFKIMLFGHIHNACFTTIFQIVSVEYF